MKPSNLPQSENDPWLDVARDAWGRMSEQSQLTLHHEQSTDIDRLLEADDRAVAFLAKLQKPEE